MARNSENVSAAVEAVNGIIAEQTAALNALKTKVAGKAAGGSGGSGSDISLGLTGASVGNGAIVKTVDADGKPTEWESAALAKADGSNVTANYEAWLKGIHALPGLKVYGKADANGKIHAYEDADYKNEITSYIYVMQLSELGNALFIYNNKTYQCVGFEDSESFPGVPSVAVFSRTSIEKNSAGETVCVVETARFDIMGNLAGTVDAPVKIQSGEIPLTSVATV